MKKLFDQIEKSVESLDPNELTALAEMIIDAAIAGDYLALKFLLDTGLRDAEQERLSALRNVLGLKGKE